MLELILSKVREAQQQKVFCQEIYFDKNAVSGENEFLFFIKPEITEIPDNLKLYKILGSIFAKIKSFQLSIRNIKVLSSGYLDKYNIIAAHYGIINKLSNNPKLFLSGEAGHKFTEFFGIKMEDANLKGSLEYLKENPGLSPDDLSHLVGNLEYFKLAPGTYVQKLELEEGNLFIVNSFHPKQLVHFTREGRCIVTFTLTGELDWFIARNNFIGATNPVNATPGSLRHELYSRSEELSIPGISMSYNGVHLSAGPIEGLIELQRYNTELPSEKEPRIDSYITGKALVKNFKPDQIKRILDNTDLEVNGKMTSVFDLTEEKNTSAAIKILKKYIR